MYEIACLSTVEAASTFTGVTIPLLLDWMYDIVCVDLYMSYVMMV